MISVGFFFLAWKIIIFCVRFKEKFFIFLNIFFFWLKRIPPLTRAAGWRDFLSAPRQLTIIRLRGIVTEDGWLVGGWGKGGYQVKRENWQRREIRGILASPGRLSPSLSSRGDWRGEGAGVAVARYGGQLAAAPPRFARPCLPCMLIPSGTEKQAAKR